MTTGIVVIDSTFLRYLTDARTVSSLETQLSMTRLEVVPSIPNVLEALKHRDPRIRELLVSAIQQWAKDRPLNPWPWDLLRLSGQALLRGKVEFYIDEELPNSVSLQRDALESDHITATRFLNGIEEAFIAPFRKNRELVQKQLKREGRRGEWPDLPSFLDYHDANEDVLGHLAQHLWTHVGLPGESVALAELRRSEVWRLALDAFGAAMYFRAILLEQPRHPAGLIDLLQLVYIAGAPNARIFVTDDGQLYETATSILRGRYPNVRVLRAGEFLQQAA